jgi:hypothetical protein
MKNYQKLHIGNLICAQLKEEGRTKKWLAAQVHCSESCLCKMLQKESIHVDLLLKISLALQHDFVEYLHNYYLENLRAK